MPPWQYLYGAIKLTAHLTRSSLITCEATRQLIDGIHLWVLPPEVQTVSGVNTQPGKCVARRCWYASCSLLVQLPSESCNIPSLSSCVLPRILWILANSWVCSSFVQKLCQESLLLRLSTRYKEHRTFFVLFPVFYTSGAQFTNYLMIYHNFITTLS